MNRRELLCTPLAALGRATGKPPAYLSAYAQLYASNPRAAALEWFRKARFGLFIHYGIYAQLGEEAWAQLTSKTPVAEYAKLARTFKAEKFDADFIADLAVAAGMRYINITTKHHDGFCLFHSRHTGFHSLNTPARRDLVAELVNACNKRSLGVFFYYSHGREWRHPHGPDNEHWGGRARPEYNPRETSYAYDGAHDLQKYVDFVAAQVTELLTNYGPVAGIWLDGIAVPLSGDRYKFHCQDLYDLIHRLQPHALVSYKQGLLGTEDFLAPERRAVPVSPGKPLEICDTLQERHWAWVKDSRHLTADQAMTALEAAARNRANLLLNTGPLADGSIHPEDVATLRAMGERIRRHGFPGDPA